MVGGLLVVNSDNVLEWFCVVEDAFTGGVVRLAGGLSG